MKYEYTGRHLEVTPALKAHVEGHFDKLKHLFEGSTTYAHVIIEVEKGKHRSEIIVKWRDSVLTAESAVSDMYQSLTKSIDKIEKQALKLKNKVIDKHHKATKIGAISEPKDDAAFEVKTPRIINVKQSSIKPMTDEEAVLRLNEEVNQFLIFREAETSKISVIFKRKDGNYGLIQP